MGARGYKSVMQVLQHRSKNKRGGRAKKHTVKLLQGSSNRSMARLYQGYLNYLKTRNYSQSTLDGKSKHLIVFICWCEERDLFEASMIDLAILESYQRTLFRYRKSDGQPLGFSTQRGHLSTLKGFFKWLVRQRYLYSNPASELEMPRQEHRLPQTTLAVDEVQQLMQQPDTKDLLGIRDRAILETLYSTAIRRLELVRLQLEDFDRKRSLLFIRQGKGHKDRVVPVGTQAQRWLEKYLDEVRPQLVLSPYEKTLFLSGYAEAINPDVVSRKVAKYIKQANIGKSGSCHLLRHSCATHMLSNGADIRFIQQLLGHASLEATQIYTHVAIDQLQLVHKQTHPRSNESQSHP